MITTLIIIFCILLYITIIANITSLMIFKGWAKEKDLDTFFEKHLKEYEINEFAYPRIHLSNIDLPYLVKYGPLDIIGRWKIERIKTNKGGVIPPWSKWNRKLNEYWNSLEKPINNNEI